MVIQADIGDLDTCTEFRQTLLARPPRLVHGTLYCLVGLVGAVFLWAYLSKVDLVVKAAGRIRPVDAPHTEIEAVSGRRVTARTAGRVIEVAFVPGATVRRDDLLVELDPESIDSDIRSLELMVAASDAELGHLHRMKEEMGERHQADMNLQLSKIAQLEEECRNEEAERQSMIHAAVAELEQLRAEEESTTELFRRRSLPELDLIKAKSARQMAEAKLEQAKIPISKARLDVLQREQALKQEQFRTDLREASRRIAEEKGQRESHAKELRTLQMRRSRLRVTAPASGVITSGDLQVGDHLEPGSLIATIASPGGFRMDVLVPNKDIGEMRPGLQARVKLNAFDYQKYGWVDGVVDFVSPDAQRDDEKDVTYFLVRIALSEKSVGNEHVRGEIKMGMEGVAEIITDENRILWLAFRWIGDRVGID